jgi:hypothetical protein
MIWFRKLKKLKTENERLKIENDAIAEYLYFIRAEQLMPLSDFEISLLKIILSLPLIESMMMEPSKKAFLRQVYRRLLEKLRYFSKEAEQSPKKIISENIEIPEDPGWRKESKEK